MMTGRDNLGGREVASGPARHIPVLLPEVIKALSPKNNSFYIDATFGAGGYAAAILEAADCRLLGIDRDPSAIAAAAPLIEKYSPRLKIVGGRFGQMTDIVRANKAPAPDGIVMDIGVSSMQLDEAERGFSFQHDGPLDMRMSASGATAADVANSLGEEDIANILYRLGEERRSRAIARAIVEARVGQPLSTTGDLVNIVERVLGRPPGKKKHPATRTFQALRIFVNAELDELAKGLRAAEYLLSAGGRLAVVTFHSLEDRMVKQFFANRTGQIANPSRHMPDRVTELPPASFCTPFKKQISPTTEETRINPRARSARLRVVERTSAAVYPESDDMSGLPELPDLPV